MDVTPARVPEELSDADLVVYTLGSGIISTMLSLGGDAISSMSEEDAELEAAIEESGQ